MNQWGPGLCFGFWKKSTQSGESLADTAKVLTRYLDGLVVRTFEQSSLEEWGAHHYPYHQRTYRLLPSLVRPLADAQTIQEYKGKIKGLKLAYIGDGNNISHSLIEVGPNWACVSGWLSAWIRARSSLGQEGSRRRLTNRCGNFCHPRSMPCREEC